MPLPDVTRSIREALSEGVTRLHEREDIREWAVRDSHLLLQHALGVSREQVMAWPERMLTPQQSATFDHLVSERLRAVPIQYLRGQQEFYGRSFLVTPDVLIPRPETELLIDEVKRYIEPSATVMIVDIGTGSGAIGVTLAAELEMARITAVDLSPAALGVTEQNAIRHRVSDRVRTFQSDLFSSLDGRVFDYVVSNPPYIAASERSSLHSQVRDHEPELALFGGEDGFEIYTRLIPEAWNHLRPGGMLFLEIGRPGPILNSALMYWSDVYTVNDLQGLPRLIVARKP
jgi:release factor glutamine methyltransferase